MIYSIKEIAEILQLSFNDISDYNISVLLTDSRSLTFPEETLFFAIKTLRNDGHRFIPELYRKGVRNFVVNKVDEVWRGFADVNFLETDDVSGALQRITAEHRGRFDIPIVGVTGSNGKTVVKEWLYQLLRNDYNITRSPRSYNSQIGVPLSVWGLDEQTEIAVIEAGISLKGEMDKLARIIKPTIGIFTYLGEAHQDNFSSLLEKLDEKITLFDSAECVIFNADEHYVKEAIQRRFPEKNLIGWSFCDRNAPLFVNEIVKDADSTLVTYTYKCETSTFCIPFIEDASIVNALHCLSLMLLLGVDRCTIEERMLLLESVAMRLEVKEGRNGCTVINDTYNSDINSFEIALDFLARRDTSMGVKRRVILSDILQSSCSAHRLYARVAELMDKKRVDLFVGIGENLFANRSLFPEGSEFFMTTEAFLRSGASDRYANELILVKGSRNFAFDEISDELSLKRHETILEINLNAVIDNYNYYKQKLHSATKMICMVKAFGYGAGSYELTKSLQDAGCDYVAVAVADEGAELRKAGITMPIMVMNPEMSSFETLFRYNLEPEIYSFRLLLALVRTAEAQGITSFPVHIKIDSGMHRLGFTQKDMSRLTEILCRQTAVLPRSVFSHFAGSDDAVFDDFSYKQIDMFLKCAEVLQSGVRTPIFRHILNTAGISRFTDYQFEGVRLGIGLYGVAPCNGIKGLKCVSSLKTTILQIKELAPEETVGYGRRGVLSRRSMVAAVPIGYADGLNRRLGNRNGEMFVNGHRVKIVGNVCMDVTMIDVTGVDCKEGDTVEVFGENILVTEIADKLGTIPYEVLTSVSSRVKRIYFRE